MSPQMMSSWFHGCMKMSDVLGTIRTTSQSGDMDGLSTNVMNMTKTWRPMLGARSITMGLWASMAIGYRSMIPIRQYC